MMLLCDILCYIGVQHVACVLPCGDAVAYLGGTIREEGRVL